MKKWILRIIGALAALYFLTILFVVPYLIRTKAPEIVHDVTGGHLSIEKAFLNPLILNLTIEGIRFTTPQDEPLFAMKRLDVNVDVLHLLWGSLSFERIGLDGPQLFVQQDRDGRFNFDWLTHLGDANTSAEPAQTERNSTLPSIVIESFDLDNGGVAFTDLSRPQPLTVQLAPIGLRMTDIRTRGKGKNRLHFYGHTDSGGLVDIKSTIRSFAPFAIDGSVEYDAGQLYLVYHFLQNISRLEVADGRIHVGLTFAVDTAHLEATKVDDINVTLKRLRIVPKQEERADALRIGGLAVDAGPIYPMRGEASVASVSVEDPYILLRRLPDGSINWQHYFPASAASSETAEAAETNESNETNAGGAWKAVIGKIAVSGGQIRFEDRALSQPAAETVDDINVTIGTVSTDKTAPITLGTGFAVNKRGRIELNATVTPEPLHAEAALKIDALMLAPFSPYVEDKSFARIADGGIYATSAIVYAPSESKADLTARGDFRLADLLVDDTRDTMPLASVGTLSAKAYLVELFPNRFFVDTAGIDSFYANVAIDRNKTLNFATLAKPTASPDKPATETKAAAKKSAKTQGGFPVRIVRTVIKNGAVHFADASLPLPFDTNIHDVGGQVLGISTLSGDTTYLNLDGEIDRYGVAKANGSLNTANPKAFTDISVAFRNIDLHSLTPYSGKFVGRAIDSGKLTVSLRYKIVDAKMQGENGFVIDKITLGDDIESSDAVSLPLDFAIALLEDRDGVIDIDMPVRGDVDNPDFAWGGVVWNAFVNLLTKAVTAPFDLIGNMLGISGDELKTVAFEAGSSTVDAASRERLDLLADALAKRPKLGITVQGTYDKALDATALKRQALIREVLIANGKENVGAQEALVPGMLEPVYEKRFGKEALEALQAEIAALDTNEENRASRYSDRLIADLTKSQPLPENALQKLAAARVSAVRTYLVTTRGIEDERIGEAEAKAVEGEDGDVATLIELDVAK